jgi:RNA ligase
MVMLKDIGLDPAELSRQIEEGWVRLQSHPTLPLFIYNYTERAQFARHWNDYTLACRGLICDSDGVVVARPWKKFFNLGEGYAEFDWDAPVEVTDKKDGSLGILYSYDPGWGIPAMGIATRGSFDSDQARHANSVFYARYMNHPDMNWDAPNDFTFLFEIIYPNNRIVLNYGDLDDLVLLGAVHKEYGYYLGPSEASAILAWPGPVTEVFPYRTLQDAFSADPRENAEGYVIRSGNKMVKIKQVDYLELHRLVTNLNERTVWDALQNGRGVMEICEPLPDEFHLFVKDTAWKLLGDFKYREQQLITEYTNARLTAIACQAVDTEGVDRKVFASVVKNSPNKKYMFALLDKKPIDGLIWQELKPAVSKE